MRTLCIRDLHCFRTSQYCGLFCTFWLLRNFNSADSHHAYYGEHCSNHHFRHCAQCVYEIYSVFKVFEIAICFAHFGFFEIWTPLILTMLAKVNVLQIIISNIAHSVYMRFTVFQSFPSCNLFCTFFLLRNFYSSDAHHANNGEDFSSPHFRYCTLWVDEIYSVFTLFEIAVFFYIWDNSKILLRWCVTC